MKPKLPTFSLLNRVFYSRSFCSLSSKEKILRPPDIPPLHSKVKTDLKDSEKQKHNIEDNDKHIEIHGFRTLSVIANKPIDPAKLSLSFTEKLVLKDKQKFAQYQQQQQQQQQQRITPSLSTDSDSNSNLLSSSPSSSASASASPLDTTHHITNDTDYTILASTLASHQPSSSSSSSLSGLPSIYERTVPTSRLRNENSSNPTPAIAYEVWHSPPEIYDWVYGFDADCEPPDRHNLKWNWLYKAWGYYAEREVFFRCAIYSFMKAQRRCGRQEFWNVFDLENTFRVELQILGLHMWFVKCRAAQLGETRGLKLSRKLFKMTIDQLTNRFVLNIEGMPSRWREDCKHALLHLMVSLDHAADDFKQDNQSFAKVIWNELYMGNRDMDHDVLYLWTEYILRERENLSKISERDFLYGWWKYGPLPTANDRARVRQELIDKYTSKQPDTTTNDDSLQDDPNLEYIQNIGKHTKKN